MTTSQVLNAPWAAPADIAPTLLNNVTDLNDQVVGTYLELASEILYYLSGSRWAGSGGTDTATFRSWPQGAGQGSWPYMVTWGQTGNWLYGSLMDNWLYPPINQFVGTHLAPMAIRLPHEPITAITAVTVDGNPFTAFRLTRAGWIERTDNLPWLVAMDTTTISYTWGIDPPDGGKNSAVAFAVELIKHHYGKACRLPQRVTSITRQGLSMAILDPMVFLPNNQTGIVEVDYWLQAVNPHHRTSRARVWSPDIPRAIHGNGTS